MNEIAALMRVEPMPYETLEKVLDILPEPNDVIINAVPDLSEVTKQVKEQLAGIALRQVSMSLNFSSRELSQKIKHLSHGTRQKLGIVFAFEHDPDLAILDEPTSGLDPLIQEAFYEILWDFQKRGKTVFLSSHILPEVEKVCHRVAIIRSGKIVALEEIEKLKQINEDMLNVNPRKDLHRYYDKNIEFHSVYLNLCKNNRIVQIIHKHRQILFDFAKQDYGREWEKENYLEHLEIIRLIEKGGAKNTAEYIRDMHLTLKPKYQQDILINR